MDKNTVLAVILSSIIILGGMSLLNYYNQKYAAEHPELQKVQQPEEIKNEEPKAADVTSSDTVLRSADTENSSSDEQKTEELPDQNFPIEKITEETDLYKIIFSTEGGKITDIQLLQQTDHGKPVSMVLDNGSGAGTFNLAFGGPDKEYIKDAFRHERIQKGKEIIHNFSRKYIKNGQIFELTKSYRIIPGEYVIELSITLETPNGKAVPLLNGNEPAYTITYGPQIGPEFKKIDGRYVIRDNVAWGPDPKTGKFKRKVYRDKKTNLIQINYVVKWAAVVGKYFAVVADPGSGDSIITWNNNPADGQDQASRLQISKPARRQSIIEDKYIFYIGPLDRKILSRYDDSAKNAFGITDMGLTNAPRTSSWLGWLETLLRWLLEFFYKLIPNYGVAIILLTFLIKLILFPFTHKSYESTSKMQAIQPKLKALQEQYKNDPQKLNAKTAELYKEEGVNPMGGCLPMLLQMPIFFALYGLLNKYFPLRGAEFIPGWITDLSSPESVYQFQNGFHFFGMTFDAIRILPFLYLGGQLLMTKVTQQGQAAGSSAQNKFLTMGMPIMFFFILYNMPSGLLLYWTMMNLITIVQQLITNYIKKNKAGGTA